LEETKIDENDNIHENHQNFCNNH